MKPKPRLLAQTAIAFTLIELLVVIAISANIRQIMRASHMFAGGEA